MADDIDYSRFAGGVKFPRNSSDLLSTNLCPACFTPLTSTVCSVCLLDLENPTAVELHDVSLAAAASLERRVALIGRIRYDTDLASQSQTAQTMAAPPATAHAAPTAAVASPSAPTAPTAPPAPAPAPTLAATRPVEAPIRVERKFSSVQVTLLVVGILLLSVAAIFFLIYAFINFGIIWRSLIIASITVAALATATLLRRRGHTATAEGIAVFGVVLIYLDAFAVRANDFFGLAASDGRFYWGWTIIMSSIVFMLWTRLSALRAPSIVGFSVFAPGVGVLVAGFAHNSEAGTRAFLVAAAIAAAGLVHRVASASITRSSQSRGTRTVERVIILCTAVGALAAGFFFAFVVAPESDWSGTIAMVALVAITAAHLWALAPASAAPLWRGFGYIFSAMGAVFAATAVGVAALRTESDTFTIMAPGIAALTVTLLLEALTQRAATVWKKFGTVATWSATAIFAITLVAPLFFAITATVSRVAEGFSNGWTFTPTDSLHISIAHTDWAVLTLAIMGTLTTGTWAATRRLRERGPLLTWFGVGVMITAAALFSTVWTTMTAWLALATIAVAILAFPSSRSKMRAAYVVPIAAAAIVSGTLGYLVSWASVSTWWIASLVVIFLLLASRFTVKSAVPRAILLGIATVIALIASNSAAHQLTFHTSQHFMVELVNGWRWVSILAVLLFALYSVPLGRLATRLDHRLMFWLNGTVAAVTVPIVIASLSGMNATNRALLLLPEYLTSFACSLLFVVALVLWVAFGLQRQCRVEAIAAAIATAPASYLAVYSVTKLIQLPEFAITIAPISTAVLVAALAMAVTFAKPHSAPRWALDTGSVLVAFFSVAYAVLQGGDFAWFVLVLAAVVVLLLSIAHDGLFSSQSLRRHLGWVSLALATAGLWWRLRGSEVTALEPYVLPLTGAVLVIAVLVQRAHNKRTASENTAGGQAGPAIALGGLLVSILPLAANAASNAARNVASGEQLRAIIIAAVCAVLMMVGSMVIGSSSAQRWWDATALSGAIGVIVLMVGRALVISTTDVARDAWIFGSFIVLVIAAFGQAIPRRSNTDRIRAVASQSLGVFAMLAVLLLELPAFQGVPLGDIRALGLVLIFSAAHVIAFIVRSAPLSRPVGWVAIALAGIAALFSVFVDTIHTPELVTVPIAVALLATGILHMNEVASARSWPWLAPGVIMLLLPSLLATFTEQPLWRLVGLGIVGVIVIIVGVARRLQAPFTLGVVAIIIHGVATFLPQLRTAYEFVPWWLWAAVAGVILTTLAFRYEQRSRDLKNAALKFASLR